MKLPRIDVRVISRSEEAAGLERGVLGVLRFGKEGRARSRHDGLHRQRLGGVPVDRLSAQDGASASFFVQQNSDPHHRCMMSAPGHSAT
jgi:hypothetical protein